MIGLLNLYALLIFFLIQPIGEISYTTCEEVRQAFSGEEIEWVGYPEGWKLPSDLEMIENRKFALGDGLWTFASASNPETLYRWYFFDFEASCDANGEHCGYHHFCAFTTEKAKDG